MKTLKLKGLDCPVCAQSLEDGLRAMPGLASVSVDFASLTMKVEGPELDALREAVRRIEPGVEVLDPAAKALPRPAPASRLRQEIVLIVMASLLAALAWLIGAGPAQAWGLPAGSSAALYILAWLLAGHDVLLGAGRNILKGRVFDELFLMSLATLGALALGQFAEAVGVMVFYKVGEAFQESAAARSRASVRGLLDLRPDLAGVRRGGAWVQVDAAEVEVGEVFRVLPGERIPLDGRVVSGESLVDSQALTGESRPRRAFPGEEVLAAALCLDGAIEVEALRLAGESSAAKIASLVEDASHAKAKTERFVTRFARIYTPVVVGLATCLALIPPLLGKGSFSTWAYQALVLLVISCPCALVISIPLGYFGGIGGAARRGILVKGGMVLDALARTGTVVFDKTGTLTKGVFKVLSIVSGPAASREEVLALAAQAESRSRHPIAASIRAAALAEGLSDGTEDEASEIRDIPGRGLRCSLGGSTILLGKRALLEEAGVSGIPAAGSESTGGDEAGATEVHLAKDGAWLGLIRIGDEAKDDAAQALAALDKLGVGRRAILTGDGAAAALPLAASLGISEVHADLLPEDKLSHLEAIIEETKATGRTTVFVGDGINDAPVLARADIGIAMGGGADAAVEWADVVLMTNEPSRVAEAVARARHTRNIVRQNIVGALGIKAAFLVLGALGIAVMWEAVIADVGVALLATLNSTRAMGRRT